MPKIKVAQFGLGPIGIESLRLVSSCLGMEIVGGVDIDPAKIGRPLSELTGVQSLSGVRAFASLEELLAVEHPDVVLHTAGSGAAASFAQLRPALAAGISAASTCEELIFPALKTPDLTAEYDELCRHSGARVVGTGVNPGFVMDVLPIMLTGVSRRVDSIYVERVVNASTRRRPLQAKIGSGMAPDEFRALFAAGKAGHAGFQQSLALLAHAMGWKLEKIEETCEPVVAPGPISTKFFGVAKGHTCGLHQRAVGTVAGEAKIILDLQMFLDAKNPHDTIVVQGEPSLNLTLNGGVAGDAATVAALVNIVPRLLASAPGVRLMTELPVPAWVNPAN
jgi:2,4-diaminopentanoate dehydrogenase